MTIVAVLSLSLSTVLHAERSTDVFPNVVNVEVQGGNVLIYDRGTLSITYQNVAEIQRKLNSGVCKNTGLRKLIVSGNKIFFVYLYKDGTLSFSVTYCN